LARLPFALLPLALLPLALLPLPDRRPRPPPRRERDFDSGLDMVLLVEDEPENVVGIDGTRQLRGRSHRIRSDCVARR